MYRRFERYRFVVAKTWMMSRLLLSYQRMVSAWPDKKQRSGSEDLIERGDDLVFHVLVNVVRQGLILDDTHRLD